jgi:hypothetical protein
VNIGPHEVAFATTRSESGLPVHMIHKDRLILHFKAVARWVEARSCELGEVN